MVLCRDTTGGRSCIDSSYWVYQDTLRKEAQWIREMVNPNGFLRRRDTLLLVSGVPTVVARDSVRAEPNGKPLETIHWAYSWAGDSLAEDRRVENFWNGNRLDRVKTTSMNTFDRTLYWGADGRLDSSIIPLTNIGYRYQYDTQGRMVGYTYQGQWDRIELDASGRLIALRVDMAEWPALDRYREFALDSFVLDGQGRLLESVSCLDYSTDSLIDRSKCTRHTYDYSLGVSLHRTPSVRAIGQVHRDGHQLVAQGVAGRSLILKILRPDGHLERMERGVGEISLDIRNLPQGLLLWSLESEGMAKTSGRIWRPAD